VLRLRLDRRRESAEAGPQLDIAERRLGIGDCDPRRISVRRTFEGMEDRPVQGFLRKRDEVPISRAIPVHRALIDDEALHALEFGCRRGSVSAHIGIRGDQSALA
jgi:hypothetical protein